MKRFVAFLVLLSHMNTSMLLPQIPEVDVYDKNGQQVEDINSVVEWILVALGIDDVPDDEDNDTGQQFLVSHFNYLPENQVIEVSKQPFTISSKKIFGTLEEKTLTAFHEVIAPPPEA